MSDLLVRLYDLPPPSASSVRRAFSAERDLICEWVRQNFGTAWAAECAGCFANGRPTCFIATSDAKLIGFACYDTTARGMFGPLGVAAAQRGRGIGRALLLAALHDMRAAGYAYAIIGGAGSDVFAFYRETVKAIEIGDSEPGLYRGMLRDV